MTIALYIIQGLCFAFVVIRTEDPWVVILMAVYGASITAWCKEQARL